MLKKRSEVKKEIYKLAVSDSEPERLLFEKFCIQRYRPIKQHQVSGYFLDLSFPEAKIAIEYDGKYHQEIKEKDIERQKNLEKRGWRFFRLANVGQSRSWYQVTNCWGTDLGLYAQQEDAMDALIKEVIWHLKIAGFNNNRDKKISSMVELLKNKIDSL